MHEESLPTLFIVSDGRGETCNHVLKAALVQFEDQEFELALRPNIRTAEQVEEIVEEPKAEEPKAEEAKEEKTEVSVPSKFKSLVEEVEKMSVQLLAWWDSMPI